MKIKIPNILTIGRIIIVPFFVISFFLPGFYGEIIPFLLFLVYLNKNNTHSYLQMIIILI